MGVGKDATGIPDYRAWLLVPEIGSVQSLVYS